MNELIKKGTKHAEKNVSQEEVSYMVSNALDINFASSELLANLDSKDYTFLEILDTLSDTWTR